ncbi:MAG: hypothetical protein M3160_04325 [Candidatus Eremiobacteraeota bacterium]|nr:hypothetical protein [Candidatus Eremiobacteraeota bacterium]
MSVGALGAQFESLLMAQMFEPLAKALGEMGEDVVRACTMSLSARNDGGFGAAVSALLEKNGRAGR